MSRLRPLAEFPNCHDLLLQIAVRMRRFCCPVNREAGARRAAGRTSGPSLLTRHSFAAGERNRERVRRQCPWTARRVIHSSFALCFTLFQRPKGTILSTRLYSGSARENRETTETTKTRKYPGMAASRADRSQRRASPLVDGGAAGAPGGRAPRRKGPVGTARACVAHTPDGR